LSRPAQPRPDVELFTEIGIIEQLSRTRIERALPPGLSSAQFGVLNHFARRGGPQGPAELAAAFQVTKGAMTNILKKLEQQRLVDIADDPEDGRRKIVTLTAAGSEAHRRALTALRPQLDALRGAFEADEFEAALPFLRALRTWLDEHR
jgi:DNA-binding MarR family transcriptional regulator